MALPFTTRKMNSQVSGRRFEAEFKKNPILAYIIYLEHL
jgi:hypothetical protein